MHITGVQGTHFVRRRILTGYPFMESWRHHSRCLFIGWLRAFIESVVKGNILQRNYARWSIERSFFPKLCRNTTKLSRDAKLNAWPQFSSIHTLNPRFHVWTLQVEEMGRYLNLKRNLFWKARRISYLLFFWVIL